MNAARSTHTNTHTQTYIYTQTYIHTLTYIHTNYTHTGVMDLRPHVQKNPIVYPL